jgi:tetraacyldisaccharide 4'-kinase
MKRLDYYWYRKSTWLWLLWPVSLLFALLAGLRRWFYRIEILAAYRPPVPVIVVGNITVGGSGKTPLVVWLSNYLREQGLRPGIVSRGYGGSARQWPQDVTADSDPVLVGDEAVLLAGRTNCPMVVAPDRSAAVRRLLAQHDVNVIISDDGLQHYALARDIEIAVVDGKRRLGNGLCLPAGPLRESARRLKKVDFVVSNGSAHSGEWSMNLQGDEAVSLKSGTPRKLAEFSDLPVHAVAGIGNPVRFFDFLRQSGLEPICHPFSDHHPYNAGDLEFAGSNQVLMTEKDAVKYRPFSGAHHWFVPVTATLPDAFGPKIIASLEKIHG